MRSTRLFSLFLIAIAASAQHGAGFRGGAVAGVPGFRSGAGPFGPPAARDGRFFGPNFGFYRGFSRGFGNFANPYYFPYLGAYSFVGDYGLLGDYALAYPAASGYPVVNNNTVNAPPDTQATSPPPSPQPQPARPVVQEYKWNEPAAAFEEQAATFIIALKDGSKRHAVMAWVQSNQLHYLDSEGRHQALAANVIDRETTERLNRQKNLNLRLPPA